MDNKTLNPISLFLCRSTACSTQSITELFKLLLSLLFVSLAFELSAPLIVSKFADFGFGSICLGLAALSDDSSSTEALLMLDKAILSLDSIRFMLLVELDDIRLGGEGFIGELVVFVLFLVSIESSIDFFFGNNRFRNDSASALAVLAKSLCRSSSKTDDILCKLELALSLDVALVSECVDLASSLADFNMELFKLGDMGILAVVSFDFFMLKSLWETGS